jgi:competence protein ComGC
MLFLIGIIFIILTIVLIITVPLISKQNNKDKFIKPKKYKIAILLISAKSERFDLEKEYWKKYGNINDNIDCFFIECDKTESFETESFGFDKQNVGTIKSICTESYIPGIYQKSLNSLKTVGDDYDFYIRGNLSTFYIFDYLEQFLQTIPTDKPILTGPCYGRNWASGTSIILNKLARDLLLKYGFDDEYYHNLDIPDDVLIGKVFDNHNIKCSKYSKYSNCLSYPLYLWVYNKNYIKNVKKVDKCKYPFLRLRNDDDLPKYKSTVNKLLLKYYNIHVT